MSRRPIARKEDAMSADLRRQFGSRSEATTLVFDPAEDWTSRESAIWEARDVEGSERRD
jgi:hypothetical protein